MNAGGNNLPADYAEASNADLMRLPGRGLNEPLAARLPEPT